MLCLCLGDTMDCEVKKTINVYLKMEEEEARWLKNYLQNSPFPDEPEQDAKMRGNFFNTIRNALEK